jgi:hypothetical protein
MKSLLTILILIFAFQACLGQEIDFEGNWYREIFGYEDVYSSYDFTRYTKEDVIKAKKRFNLIKQFPAKDDWEGIYTRSTELGTLKLHWSSKGGFVDYRVYHTLSSLDFGTTLNKTDSVKLISEKPSISKRKSILSNNLIKVKFGARHFLVPENRLQDFVDRTIGLSTDLSDFMYYWWKDEDSEKELFGLPVLPEKYRHLLRFPISTKITLIGNRKIHQNKFDDGTINYEEVYRFVTLGAGTNKKIKKGMNFFVEDLGEWVEITKLSLNSSIGKIRRGLDKNKQEECLDEEQGQGEIIPCKEIKIGMKAKTQLSKSFF